MYNNIIMGISNCRNLVLYSFRSLESFAKNSLLILVSLLGWPNISCWKQQLMLYATKSLCQLKYTISPLVTEKEEGVKFYLSLLPIIHNDIKKYKLDLEQPEAVYFTSDEVVNLQKNIIATAILRNKVSKFIVNHLVLVPFAINKEIKDHIINNNLRVSSEVQFILKDGKRRSSLTLNKVVVKLNKEMLKHYLEHKYYQQLPLFCQMLLHHKKQTLSIIVNNWWNTHGQYFIEKILNPTQEIKPHYMGY